MLRHACGFALANAGHRRSVDPSFSFKSRQAKAPTPPRWHRWLEEQLCPAAGCKIENVFVIPGNHDVDRKVETDPAQLLARDALRSRSANHVEAELRKWMRAKIAVSVIFGPIENYNRFAAKFLCALRPYIDDVRT
jgi:hypothetical protein